MAQQDKEQKKLITEVMNKDAKDGLYTLQTAVEWLVEQIKSDQNQKALSPNEWVQVIKQAKAIEKKQIETAYEQGVSDGYEPHYSKGENYYNEIYGQ